MMLLLLVLNSYGKLTHTVIFRRRVFERVAAVRTQWFKKTSLIVGINMSEVVGVSLIS